MQAPAFVAFDVARRLNGWGRFGSTSLPRTYLDLRREGDDAEPAVIEGGGISERATL